MAHIGILSSCWHISHKYFCLEPWEIKCAGSRYTSNIKYNGKDYKICHRGWGLKGKYNWFTKENTKI